MAKEGSSATRQNQANGNYLTKGAGRSRGVTNIIRDENPTRHFEALIEITKQYARVREEAYKKEKQLKIMSLNGF